MSSTFMGLETSKRGLTTQQSALYTTGHNIANANTEGYSRQRVNMQTTNAMPYPGLNSGTGAGQIGTGVEAGTVQRIRDQFVDTQYRQESNKLGFWQSKSEIITQVEDVLNEPSDYGLAQSLNEFWNSLQDLSVNPENGGARSVVVQRGIAVADSFHYMANSITQIQTNTANEIGISLTSINSVLQQIAGINEQIQRIEPNGYLPNDLYDARDKLIDELSTNLPLDLQYTKSGGNAIKTAEGAVTVSVKLNNGTSLKLVDGKDFAQLRNSGASAIDGVTPTGMVTGFHLVKVDANGAETELNNDWSAQGTQEDQDINYFNDLGKLKSLVNSYGYSDAGIEKGYLPDMLEKLNTMAIAFADEFNKIHVGDGSTNYPQGSDLYGNVGEAFFVESDGTTGIDASNIKVSQTIIDDPNKIAASNSAPDTTNAEPGNGKLALTLANMKFKSLSDLGDVSTQTYFEGQIIGQLGVDGQQAARMQYNAETLQQSVTERRASISSVSLDEEMTNMITFQQAYNASARMITVIDETLDKIINGMGRVGL